MRDECCLLSTGLVRAIIIALYIMCVCLELILDLDGYQATHIYIYC